MPNRSIEASPRLFSSRSGLALLCVLGAAAACSGPREEGSVPTIREAASGRAPDATTERSDPAAVELARDTIDAMGGWEAWERTRFLRWNFFGGRRHWWDRREGRVRIESDDDDGARVWLMNVSDGTGRVFLDGEEIVDSAERQAQLARGKSVWINDSYWLVMPFKLLDPGVTLKSAGVRELPDGTPADVLELTFEPGTGDTPENRYEVWISRGTELVEQWAFYRAASDEEPGFTLPWTGWETFGAIRIATDRGRGRDWAIEAPDDVPDAVFEALDGVP